MNLATSSFPYAQASLAYDKVDGQAVSARILNRLAEQNAKRTTKAAMSTGLILTLAACGGADSEDEDFVSVSLTQADNGAFSLVSESSSITLRSASAPILDLADAADNSYRVNLDAAGTGTLELNFADAKDVVELVAGTQLSGFSTLRVTGGTVDARAVDMSGFSTIQINSKLILNADQLSGNLYIQSMSGDGEIEIIVSTQAQADALVDLIEAGSLQLINVDFNLTAASNATISATALAAAETSGGRYVSSAAGNNTSSNSTDNANNTVVRDANNIYTISDAHGDAVITTSGTNTIITSAVGGAASFATANLGPLVANGINVSMNAAVMDSPVISGTASATVNALEDNADIDLSGITVTGARQANVTDDVTFTGDLGTFTTTVASAQTFTAAGTIVDGKTINGAGHVAVTAMQSALAADLSGITNTGSQTATFASGSTTFVGDFGTFDVVVASGASLRTEAVRADRLDFTGAGSVTITDSGDASKVINVLTTGTNSITLGAGDDRITTGAGADTVVGGAGNDRISTGAGNDTITGGAGADVINAGGGTNTITDAGVGADVITHNTAGATVVATATGTGTITLTASQTGATVTAAGVAVTVNASTSTAAVTLTKTGDGTEVATFTGGSGNDTITGGAGADTIIGGAGDDTITGGLGADTIDGGAGSDTIVFVTNADGAAAVTTTDVNSADDDFAAVAGIDTDDITFDIAEDVILIDGALEASLEALGVTGTSAAAIDFDAVGIYVIVAADANLGGDDFGDVSDIAANATIGFGASANHTAGDVIIFTIENDAGTATGVYFFQDVDGDGDVSDGDIVALLGIVGDTALTATDIIV